MAAMEGVRLLPHSADEKLAVARILAANLQEAARHSTWIGPWNPAMNTADPVLEHGPDGQDPYFPDPYA